MQGGCAVSSRLFVPVFGVGFVLLLLYGCYLQWQIWHTM
jgi:hypothetical protein